MNHKLNYNLWPHGSHRQSISILHSGFLLILFNFFVWPFNIRCSYYFMVFLREPRARAHALLFFSLRSPALSSPLSILHFVPGMRGGVSLMFFLFVCFFLFCNLFLFDRQPASQPASAHNHNFNLCCSYLVFFFSIRFRFYSLSGLLLAASKMCVFGLVNKSGCCGVPSRIVRIQQWFLHICISTHSLTHTRAFTVAQFARAILFSIDLYSIRMILSHWDFCKAKRQRPKSIIVL